MLSCNKSKPFLMFFFRLSFATLWTVKKKTSRVDHSKQGLTFLIQNVFFAKYLSAYCFYRRDDIEFQERNFISLTLFIIVSKFLVHIM